MNDSADIKNAAEKLQSALSKLENVLSPLIQDLGRLKSIESESEVFKLDRSSLAKELDQAKDRENTYIKREEDFTTLTDETITELDRVIRQVNTVLTQRGSG